MMFSTRPHNAWRRRFAFIPVQIGKDRWLWWARYEWRWINEYRVKFERRAVVDGREVVFADEIPLYD